MDRRSFFQRTLGAVAAAAMLRKAGFRVQTPAHPAQGASGSAFTTLRMEVDGRWEEIAEVKEITAPTLVNEDSQLKRSHVRMKTGKQRPVNVQSGRVDKYRLSLPDGVEMEFSGYCILCAAAPLTGEGLFEVSVTGPAELKP